MGFYPQWVRRSPSGRGALPASTADVQGLVSTYELVNRNFAPLGAGGGKTHKSDVISPLLPIYDVGKLKRRETGRALVYR